MRVVCFQIHPSIHHVIEKDVKIQRSWVFIAKGFADMFCEILVCCLYHKTRAVGESSSDDDSDDSSSSSDKDASINSGRRDDGRARMGGEGSSKGKHKSHSHMSSEGCAEGKAQRTRKSPNAYEKMPKSGVSKKTER